jgi:hypothetical protein
MGNFSSRPHAQTSEAARRAADFEARDLNHHRAAGAVALSRDGDRSVQTTF